MVPLYKGAFGSPEQHPTDIRTNALETWEKDLSTQAEVTAQLYKKYFKEFCDFIGETPDQILEQRIQDDKNQDKKTKRRYETFFRLFLKHKKKQKKPNGETFAPTTLQTIYASIRSFFELHDYPLKMRRKDYPKGKALGVRRATRNHILKLFDKYPNNIRLRAVTHAINDSGLGVSDLKELKCGLFLNPEIKIIMYQALRQKTKDTIKTFFGEESIQVITEYINHRRKGTRKLKPETITAETPLFVKYVKGKPVKMDRKDLSTLVENAFLQTGEKHLSAHSIRKKLQTCLEKGGMNPNWIDQILGHDLINSRDAYSLPTDEELQEAYEKAYNEVRIHPAEATAPQQKEQPEIIEVRSLEEAKQAILKGYHQAGEFDGIKLYTK
jgi:site-specific recombinase XerD